MSNTIMRRVGIIVDPTLIYCRRVVQSIVTVGAQANWEWLLLPTEVSSALTAPLLPPLDGIIGYFADAKSTAHVLRPGLPVVDISAAVTASTLLRVTTDNIAVGRIGATYLLSLGLAHFGFFGWRDHPGSQSRDQGFMETILAAGLSCKSLLLPGDVRNLDAAERANRELGRWVSVLPKPAGVLASNDRSALQLLAVCQMLGIAVPGSVAVLGVENDDLYCEIANPSLSSIPLSTEKIGYEAARMLDRLMRGEQAQESTILVPPGDVVPRQSSGLKVLVDSDVAAAVRYIALYVKDGLQVDDVVREVRVSRRSLDQRFQSNTGHTVAEEIGRARVELAKNALAETDEPMDRVAAMSGFSNAKQLGASFRKTVGTPPSVYRQHGLQQREHDPTSNILAAQPSVSPALAYTSGWRAKNEHGG